MIFTFALVAMLLQTNTVSPAPATTCVAADPALITDTQSAFAFELKDPQVTHFLTEITSASPSAAHTVLDAIIFSSKGLEQRRNDGVVDGLCPTLSDYDALARADRLVGDLWKLDGFTSQQRLTAITRAIENAVFALDHRSEVTAADLTSIRSPFAAIAKPVLPSAVTCSMPDADAMIDHLAALHYPQVAADNGSSGKVAIDVMLTADGDIARAVVAKNETTGGSSDALAEAAIRAAVETTYHPFVVKCVSEPGAYLFQANFAP